MARDKLLHLSLGCLAIACALIGMVVFNNLGVGALLAYTTTTTGLVYEFQQWYRNEGEVELMDAIATAIPGWMAWCVIEIVKGMT